MSKPTVFISYSRKDAEWKDRLANHLGVAEKQGHLNQWFDTLIGAGEDWEPQIESALESLATLWQSSAEGKTTKPPDLTPVRDFLRSP